ncbi:MAG: MurR/RpiR family transcriptional regulator [Oscillospiraceae bacterium]|nr:MurR/RpiR family transcriptional regulator [Oscillospiraceae bacterium]
MVDIDILLAIEAKAGGFSKGRRRIAEYILQNYDKAAFMTANKLAKKTDVSESTVVRFAAELGYDGYPEMRRALQSTIRSKLTSVQRIQVAKDTIDSRDILSHVLSSDIDQIRLTMDETDSDDFTRAVNSIANAKNIYIFGLRSSSFLANFMGFYFNLLFNNSRVLSESPSVFEELIRLSEGDVLIAISFPRYSQRTIRAIDYARDVGAEIIAITDSRMSPLAKLSDITLCARSDMVLFLDTLVAPLSLINALIVAVSEKAPGDLHENFERLERIWDEYGVYEKLDA